jgi:hypothetical protein
MVKKGRVIQESRKQTDPSPARKKFPLGHVSSGVKINSATGNKLRLKSTCTAILSSPSSFGFLSKANITASLFNWKSSLEKRSPVERPASFQSNHSSPGSYTAVKSWEKEAQKHEN